MPWKFSDTTSQSFVVITANCFIQFLLLCTHAQRVFCFSFIYQWHDLKHLSNMHLLKGPKGAQLPNLEKMHSWSTSVGLSCVPTYMYDSYYYYLCCSIPLAFQFPLSPACSFDRFFVFSQDHWTPYPSQDQLCFHNISCN